MLSVFEEPLKNVTKNENGTYNYEFVCPFCGEAHTIVFTEDDVKKYNAYKAGEGYIQTMFPNKTAEEREMIKTGICQKCWDEMFAF